nr:uncharacterized protein LOC108080997 [Drosophila kikkawai]
MQFPLIVALTLTLLGFAWGNPTEGDKQKFCEFLKDVEEDREILVESLTKKTLDVEKNVIKKLGRNSDFETFLKENSTLQLLTTQQKLDFLLKFRCAYKNKILANPLFKDTNEFRQTYLTYRSETNKEIKTFDNFLSRDATRMVKKMKSTSDATKQEFNNALKTYLDRKGQSAHCMMNTFLTLKTKYGCN